MITKRRRNRAALLLVLMLITLSAVVWWSMKQFRDKMHESELNALSEMQLISTYASEMTTFDDNRTSGAGRHQNLVVAHISDTHVDSTRFNRFCSFVNSYEVIDFGIHTGDINNRYAENPKWFINAVNSSVKPIYLTIGNHDIAPFLYTTDDLQDSIYRKYFKPIQNKIGKVSPHCCYYRDFKTNGGGTIRFVMLNSFDYSSAPISTFYIKSYYSTEQLVWLSRVLKDAAEKELYVVICAHMKNVSTIKNTTPFFQTYKEEIPSEQGNNFQGDPVGDMVHAWTEGENLLRCYESNDSGVPSISINANFSGRKGQFIAFMNGHWHGDLTGYSVSHPEQLILNINAGKATRFYAPEDNRECLYSDLPRSLDDDTQDCYNVYVFNLKKRLVHVVRIGSNLTTDGKIRKTYSYKW